MYVYSIEIAPLYHAQILSRHYICIIWVYDIRPIDIVTAISKILKICLMKLGGQTSVNDNQFGFKQKHSMYIYC